MDQILLWMMPLWPFVSVSLVFGLIGRVTKASVWTKENARLPGQLGAFYRFGYRTLPLHPVVSGMLLGIIWRSPHEKVQTLAESMAAFAMCGVVCTWVYDIFRQGAKERAGTLSDGYSLRPESEDE